MGGGVASDPSMPGPTPPTPRTGTPGALRTTLDLLAEGVLVLAFLGATLVTWVPAVERRAMLQTAVLGLAIGCAYAAVAVRAVRRIRRAPPTEVGSLSWESVVPAALRAAAALTVAVLALLRAAAASQPG